ncbi:MAG: prepilin-type N-terminal cleavage/methylation domain-containing protein [Lacipirellulaceae bacterium]
MKRTSQYSFSVQRRALTLVEMLVGMAITLIMMAAVVNLFANVSGGVSNRRAAIEMNGTLRQARGLLQRDLAGATCPGVPWQNPESGNGYIEIIEGRYSDRNPSSLVDGNAGNGELDYATSIIPGTQVGNGLADAVTDGGGLGDHDDILALTVRSDNEPFVGQVNGVTVESNLAEVIWYSVENPTNGSLGEPGLRTVYRRVLLIAPWVGPLQLSSTAPIITRNPVDFFQRNDISARFDTTTDTWIPNTLSDLTKRENRAMRAEASLFPHVFVSEGRGYAGAPTISLSRNDFGTITNPQDAAAQANYYSLNGNPVFVSGYNVSVGGRYASPPIVAVSPGSGTLAEAATARPVMRAIEQGAGANSDVLTLASLTHGPAPYYGDREGEDVVLSDILAWDLRVFDPGAPLVTTAGVVLEPSDLGWYVPTALNDVVGFGAYVDLGWGDLDKSSNITTAENYQPPSNLPRPLFRLPRNARQFTGYPCVYDTWSTHYESDGLDQDNRDGDLDLQAVNANGIPLGYFTGEDEGTDGFDNDNANGVDDALERETSPPYDVKLPAVKVIMRAYERDSRQIRETSVTQSFQ